MASESAATAPPASASSTGAPSSSTPIQSLIPLLRTTKVSSVLNDSREYGKQNLFDGHAETCWNSAQGTPQFIQLAFLTPVTLHSLRLTFQGGFVGKSLLLSATTVGSPKKFLPLQNFEPKDDNQEQMFEVPQGGEANTQVTNIKITFPTSTDFYGRITLYKLDVLGTFDHAAAEAAGVKTA